MLSRVAESIFWINRYIERAENYARFIDVNLNMILDLPPGYDQQWRPLVNTTGDSVDFETRYGQYTKNNVIVFLTSDLENPNSILTCLNRARENARTVRDSLTTEMWEHINELYLRVREKVGAIEWTNEQTLAFLKEIKMSSYLFAGIMNGTVARDEGWHFAQIGRQLERADKTTRLLDVKYFILLPNLDQIGTPLDLLQWTAMLKSASALDTYRGKYGALTPYNIVKFLILDAQFPRAIKYCLTQLQISLHAVSDSVIGDFQNLAEKKLGLLISELNYTDVDDIFEAGLHEYLDKIQLHMNEVGNALYAAFFSLENLEAVKETRSKNVQKQ